MTALLDSTDSATQVRGLYLELLKNCLTGLLWDAEDGSQLTLPGPGLAGRIKQTLGIGAAPSARARQPKVDRIEGRDWPVLAHTMIGLKRLNNIQFCIEQVLSNSVPGDVIETGAWRGGATIFMRGVLKAHQVSDRTVWVADSFEGLPKPNADKYPADAGDKHHEHAPLAVSLEEVRSNFERYGLLDDQVKFLKGWFKDTLPSAPIKQLAVARLDGDMYESTIDALTHLYPKLSPGGFLIVDDYGAVAGCKQAVEDYRRQQRITAPIETIDQWGVFWQRAS
jgi:O-methyltransferase